MSGPGAVVRGILRSPLHRVLSRSLMLLTYCGGGTGRQYTIPAAYARHGEEIVVLAGEAQRKSRWRNMRPRCR